MFLKHFDSLVHDFLIRRERVDISNNLAQELKKKRKKKKRWHGTQSQPSDHNTQLLSYNKWRKISSLKIQMKLKPIKTYPQSNLCIRILFTTPWISKDPSVPLQQIKPKMPPFLFIHTNCEGVFWVNFVRLFQFSHWEG